LEDSFYNIDQPWVKLLETSYEIIQEELLSVIDLGVATDIGENWSPAHPSYVSGPSNNQVQWKTFEFEFFGIKHPIHRAQCPKTSELLNHIPELITAHFSLLKPQTRVKPHKGYSRMILRNHLPLIVPSKGDMGIRVGSDTRRWEEGKLLSFYDFLDHEAWNLSDDLRAVLMFDIPHPSFNYSKDEICKYKIDNLDDPYLFQSAPKEQWIKWYEKGTF
jgi:aspartyl/asparaginyl beta-hydroxylase (cupin superfamily)